MQWTRETAARSLEHIQNFNTVGDFQDEVVDGDGRRVLIAAASRALELTEKDMGELLAFVLNDYATAFCPEPKK